MDLEKIEGLVKIIEDSSLNEFTYKDKDVKITMSKLDHPPVVAAGVPVAASAPVNTHCLSCFYLISHLYKSRYIRSRCRIEGSYDRRSDKQTFLLFFLCFFHNCIHI